MVHRITCHTYIFKLLSRDIVKCKDVGPKQYQLPRLCKLEFQNPEVIHTRRINGCVALLYSNTALQAYYSLLDNAHVVPSL